MARPLRIEYPGALYHVTSRGNAKQAIYLSDSDYEDFLDVLCGVVRRYNWLIHAYCLMGNHYHLMVETPDGNLSAGMRQLNGVYTQKFNWKHQRVGHIFQGRFKAIIVDKESYLAELARYIALNPVRAGITKKPEQWRWSSHLQTAGFEAGLECLTTEWLLGLFGRNKKSAQEKYMEFVKAGEPGAKIWDNVAGQILLGSEGFVEKMRKMLAEKENLSEIPRAQRLSGRPAIEQIFQRADHRLQAAYEAHVKYGYRLKEIGDYLGAHYATVSKMVKKIEREDL
jgi:REP element-mobilizing transposase RayT